MEAPTIRQEGAVSRSFEMRVSQAALNFILRSGDWHFDHPELRADLKRFREKVKYATTLDTNTIFMQFPEVRSLAYYRWKIGKGRFLRRMLGKLLQHYFPPQVNFYLRTRDVGPGFCPVHAFSMLVNARKIGCNVTIFHSVTVGHNGPGKTPTIGDGVTIYANVSVIGDISIGDHAVVGTGSVVTKDVPPRAVVAGNPARIIGQNRACHNPLESSAPS